jgi:large subunit ribosomal protein L18
MAKNAVYSLKFRRRRQGLTNYSHRLALLKSGKPRLVVRVSNKYVLAQVVKTVKGQDSVVCQASSKELVKHGWKHSFKNVPASYLTGLLVGRKCSLKELVLDGGVSKPSQRVFAVLQGCLDAGKKVPHSDKALPPEERVRGKHINEKLSKDLITVKEKLLKHGKKKAGK